MARTLALYLAPALLIGAGWMRLEEGDRPGLVVVWMALLAVAPALARPRWARALGAVVALSLAVRAAFGVSPLDARPFDSRHDFFGPFLSGVRDGVLDFYEVGLPFNPAEQPLMNSVLLLAIFGFCLAVALAVAARRPLAAGLALLAGAAWPATLVSGSGLLRGALILATVLTLLAWARPRPSWTVRPVALAGAALIAAALAASSSEAVAKGEFLNWKRWDPYDRPAQPVSVRYVWNANYGGISFPKKETTVLTVSGPRRSQYWRATTLDVFDGLRWQEQLRLLGRSDAPVELPADPLLPAVARDHTRWLEAEVTIEALRDRRLPGPTMPVAYDPQRIGAIDYGAGGTALLVTDLEHGDRYRVWAYAPRPTPVELARAVPSPATTGPESAYLQLVPGATAPSFSASDRDARLAELLAHDAYGRRLRPYRPLFEQAREVVGRPRNQYAAVVALEAWLRSEGGFRYDEQPQLPRGVPPLVSFVTVHKRGYCQHYAGAMALMLRYLGIPARVAAGFTSGDYESRRKRWRVTDHDAHAWVEVWFEGWGWLPFDPTPGRGQLSGTYTAASVAFSPQLAQQAAGDLGLAGASSVLGEFLRSRLEGTGTKEPDVIGGLSGVGARVSERGASLLRLLALVGAALVAAIALAKLTMRLARHATRDPRRAAAACRRELIDFLADQRLDVPPGATLGELARTVSRELGVDAGPFARATAAARFAPAPEAVPAAREARRELRALRGSLRRRLGPVRRARGLVSLRSLGFTG